MISNLKVQNLSSNFKGDVKARSYQFGLAVIRLTDNLPNKRSAWVIADQLIRSATSIGANQVEARASSSRLEFKKFIEIALKSANETEYWLNLLRDSKLTETENIAHLIQEVQEIAKILGKSVITLKASR